jgi:hypothetical protein
LIVEELNITIILLDKKFERNGVHSRELRGHIILGLNDHYCSRSGCLNRKIKELQGENMSINILASKLTSSFAILQLFH